MSRIWLSAAFGTAALLGLAGFGSAAPQHGGHGGGHSGGHVGHSSHVYSGHGGYSRYGGYGGHGSNGAYRGYGHGGYGYHNYGGYRGYGYGGYGLSLGLYLGSRGYGYGYPYYGTSYYYEPSYVVPSYNYIPPVYSDVLPSENTSLYYSPDATPAAIPSDYQDPNIAMFEVRVPANAELWFEGAKMQQSGTVRHFVSPSLQPGKTFIYGIRARWTDANGTSVDRTKQIQVQAGARVGVDFSTS